MTRLAIDETAARRGQDYVTLFVDIDQARVMFATEGNDADTVAAFADDLTAHGGDPDAISQVCIDMSPAFTKGIAENLPNAAITFDKFHAVKIINDAVDQVRRAEQEEQGLLRGTRYLWLRNPQTCPLANARRSLVCRRGTSRPPVRIRSAWPFRTFMAGAICAGRRELPEEVVFLGHP